MSSIILESSFLSSSSSVSNSEWTSNLAEGILINSGDAVSIKNVFLDSGKNDPDDVIFEQDTQVNMSFGYYVIDYSNTDKEEYQPAGNVPWPNATYDTYIPYTIDQGPAIYADIGRLYFINTYPTHGQPFPQYPWMGATVQFEYIDINGAQQTWPFYLDPNGYHESADPVVNTFYWDVNPNKTGILMSSFKQVVGADQLNFNFAQFGLPYPKDPDRVTLFTGDIQFTIPKGSYNSQNLAKYITDQMSTRTQLVDSNEFVSGNQLLRRTDERELRFTRISTDAVIHDPTVPDANNDWSYEVNEIYQIGSSQNSLQYNLDAQRNIFSFGYLHTPYLDDEGDEVILDAVDAGGNFWTVNQASGIFLISVSPQSLWQDMLGFDLSKLLVIPEVHGNTTIIRRSMLELGRSITGNYIGLQSMITEPTQANPFTMKLKPPVHNQPIATLSDATYSIDANSLNSNGTSGYYLIEISGLKQKYIYDQNVKFGINGIVSKQYNASSLIVGFDDCAIPFVNTTPNPILLNSLTIRILDPITKEPADDLGDNNTVLLELFRNSESEKTMSFAKVKKNK